MLVNEQPVNQSLNKGLQQIESDIKNKSVNNEKAIELYIYIYIYQ